MTEALQAATIDLDGVGVPEAFPKVPGSLLQPAQLGRIALDTLFDWTLILLCVLGMGATPDVLYPLWVVVMAGRLNGLGINAHELCHFPPARRKRGFALLCVLNGYPLGTTVAAMRYHHLRHHRNSRLAVDPYQQPDVRGRPLLFLRRWLGFSLLVPIWVLRSFVGSAAFFFPALRSFYGRVLLQDREDTPFREHPEIQRALARELPLAATWSLVLVWGFRSPEILWFWGIPVLVAGFFCGYRLLREHIYTEVPDRSLSSLFATTRDHGLGLASRVFLAPRNIGYHIVHHIHPLFREGVDDADHAPFIARDRFRGEQEQIALFHLEPLIFAARQLGACGEHGAFAMGPNLMRLSLSHGSATVNIYY